MIGFERKSGVLHCDSVSLPSLAEKYGTPLYAYSKSKLVSNCETFIAAFKDYPMLPCYAVKANGNLSILKEMAKLGFGADIVSVGELERALIAGIPAEKIVYSSIGKRPDEIRRALEVGILAFNVESVGELEQINSVAVEINKRAPVSLRINPNIDAKTHPYIATGLYTSKFGITEKELAEAIKKLKSLSHLDTVGLSTHIGSQITSVRPFRDAAKRMALVATQFQKEGFPLKFIDMGGGYGITYKSEKIPEISAFAKALIQEIKGTGLLLVTEPGRTLIGNTGVLLTKVLGIKKTPKKTFVVVDGAMNDLIRPALYSAYHPIEVVGKPSKKKLKVDIVGPVCESGDCFGSGRELPEVKAGELVVIGCAGAYGFSMASNYNTRGKPAEVLVDGKTSKIIRKRETLPELWDHEIL